MNISGIRPTEGFYTYNINKINEQRSQLVQGARDAQKIPGTKAEQEQKTALESDRPEQKFTSLDFAQSYEPEAVYEMKGADSDIHSLDMEKAISDMQKDQLLLQYQFFVGNNSHEISDSAALVNPRLDENFNL